MSFLLLVEITNLSHPSNSHCFQNCSCSFLATESVLLGIFLMQKRGGEADAPSCRSEKSYLNCYLAFTPLLKTHSFPAWILFVS